MSDFKMEFTPAQRDNAIFFMLFDIHSKLSSIQAFISEYLSDNSKEGRTDKDFENYLNGIAQTNRLELIAEITRRFSS
ncbi:MAG: hypothetical protein AB1775_10810 [Bacteroidota bacterium]